jgi:hypothetical protein
LRMSIKLSLESDRYLKQTSVARSRGLNGFYRYHVPRAYARGFMLPPASCGLRLCFTLIEQPRMLAVNMRGCLK